MLLRWQPKSPPPALRGIRFPPCATSPAAARVHGQATAPRKASARIRGHLKACSPTAHQQVGDRKPPRRTASFAEVHGLAQPVQMLRTPLFILMSTRLIRKKEEEVGLNEGSRCAPTAMGGTPDASPPELGAGATAGLIKKTRAQSRTLSVLCHCVPLSYRKPRSSHTRRALPYRKHRSQIKVPVVRGSLRPQETCPRRSLPLRPGSWSAH